MPGTRYHFADTYGVVIDRKSLKPRIYPATEDFPLKPVISLPLALPRRPALDGRSFPNQRNRSAKVGFVDLGGVGLDLEGKISYGHLAPFKLVMERYTGSYQWKPAPIARGIMYKIEHWESVSPVLMTRL